MKKVSDSFKAVFAGNATNQQFINVFFTLLPVIIIIVLFFMRQSK